MNILMNLNSILTTIAIIMVLLGAGRSIWQGKILLSIEILVMGSVLVFLIAQPDNFSAIGGYIISFIKSLGVSVNA